MKSKNLNGEILLVFDGLLISDRSPCPSTDLFMFNFIVFVRFVTVSTGFVGDKGGDDDNGIFSIGGGMTYGYSTRNQETIHTKMDMNKNYPTRKLIGQQFLSIDRFTVILIV